MGSRHIAVSLTLLAAVLTASSVSAQRRTKPVRTGAVVVRPVQVREVRVNQAPPEQRPDPGSYRPIDPGVISRPHSPSQRTVVAPRSRNIVPRPTGGRNHRHYSFKPRHHIGYGLVVGYPVVYPYAYPYVAPYAVQPGAFYNGAAAPRNTYSNVENTYSNVETVARSPFPATSIECDGAAPCGGISFDVTPSSAQVYVDGVVAGAVDEFTSTTAPLLLTPGEHYIEVRLPGYRTAAFDISIGAGEVTPYQGTLEQLRLRVP